MDKMQNKPPIIDRPTRAVVIAIALIAMISSFLPSQNPYAIISKFIETSRAYPNGLGTLLKLHAAYTYSKLIGWHITPELIEELLYGNGENFDFRQLFIEGLRQLYINEGIYIREIDRDGDDKNSKPEPFHISDELKNGSDIDRVSDFTQRLVDSIPITSDTFHLSWVDNHPVITYQVGWDNYSPVRGQYITENELANSLGDFGVRITINNYTFQDTEVSLYKRLVISEGQIEFFDRYDWTRTDRKISVRGYVGDILDAMGISKEIFESLGIDVDRLDVSLKDSDIAELALNGIAHEFDLSAKFQIDEFAKPVGIYVTKSEFDLLTQNEG